MARFSICRTTPCPTEQPSIPPAARRFDPPDIRDGLIRRMFENVRLTEYSRSFDSQNVRDHSIHRMFETIHFAESLRTFNSQNIRERSIGKPFENVRFAKHPGTFDSQIVQDHTLCRTVQERSIRNHSRTFDSQNIRELVCMHENLSTRPHAHAPSQTPARAHTLYAHARCNGGQGTVVELPVGLPQYDYDEHYLREEVDLLLLLLLSFTIYGYCYY